MTFQLEQTVPWGRSFDEYVAMFGLSDADLAARILGCGDGPASFNASLTRRGGQVISVDPLYVYSADEIRGRIRAVTPVVLEQVRQNAGEFVWQHIASVDELARIRQAAMNNFLGDYAADDARSRYVPAALPELPFARGEFDLALCSHLLFLYGEQHSLAFHVDSLVELCRVATEVRVFPLVELSGAPSRHIDAALEALQDAGFIAAVHRVEYEFQRGGNQMLTVAGPVG